jgi:hypothetical protein
MTGINVYKAVPLFHHMIRVKTNNVGKGGSEFVAFRSNGIPIIN